MHAQILLFDGFDELDALAPWEVLRMAAEAGADLAVTLACAGEPRSIVAAHGLPIAVERSLDTPQCGDLLIVPGGGWATRAERGAWAEAQRGELPPIIARAAGDGAVVASVCTGAMLLARAALLRDRHAVTHHSALADLRAAGALVEDARVVDDGELITAGGITSGLDLALWLVERFFGADLEQRLERRLEYERRGPLWQRETSR